MRKEFCFSSKLLLEWNQCHGAFYQIRESDLVWNLEQQSALVYELISVKGVPALIAMASEVGRSRGISGKTLWLSLWGLVPQELAHLFLNELKNIAVERGKSRLALAGEEFHFLPGVPIDQEPDRELGAAAGHLGFKEAEAADFVGELDNPAAISYIESSKMHASESRMELAEASDKEAQQELSRFMQKEFSGRWYREFEFWKERADCDRVFWNLLKNSQGEVLGFSRLGLRGRARDIGSGWNPGALRLPLASESPPLHTDSCLGPIGVASELRGKGVGKILLGLSLDKLLAKNAKRICIDWTDAYNYYMPLGFQVARRYRSLWLDF